MKSLYKNLPWWLNHLSEKLQLWPLRDCPECQCWWCEQAACPPFLLFQSLQKQSIFFLPGVMFMVKKKNQQMKQAFFILRKINNIRCWWFQTVFHSGYITDLTNHNLWILRVIQWNESSYMYLSQHMLFISTSAWCTHVLEMIILVIKFHTCIYIYINRKEEHETEKMNNNNEKMFII